MILNLASKCPEGFLDFLPLVAKRQTSSYCLVVPRTAYPVYSLGATARMFRIIRRIRSKLKKLSISTLVLRDPNDHLSDQESLEILKSECPSSLLEVIELEDAHHELLAGKHRQQAFQLISEFLAK
jgi:esterase/lipase